MKDRFVFDKHGILVADLERDSHSRIISIVKAFDNSGIKTKAEEAAKLYIFEDSSKTKEQLRAAFTAASLVTLESFRLSGAPEETIRTGIQDFYFYSVPLSMRKLLSIAKENIEQTSNQGYYNHPELFALAGLVGDYFHRFTRNEETIKPAHVAIGRTAFVVGQAIGEYGENVTKDNLDFAREFSETNVEEINWHQLTENDH